VTVRHTPPSPDHALTVASTASCWPGQGDLQGLKRGCF
jgi:hypothetical protein